MRLSADYDRWRAAKTVRLHTAPQIRQENVAEHTHGVLTCLIRWHPNPSRDLLVAATLHDLGENLSGDIPSPVLRENPQLAKTLEKMEKDFVEKTLGFRVPSLTEEDKCSLMAADKYDFAMFCYHEYRLGNQNLSDFVSRSLGYLRQEFSRVSENTDPYFFIKTLIHFSEEIVHQMTRGARYDDGK